MQLAHFIHFYKPTRHSLTKLLQLRVICFAPSFMETLGQGGAGTCKSIDFL